MRRVTLTADKTIYVGKWPWWIRLRAFLARKKLGTSERPFTTIAAAMGVESFENDVDLGGHTLTVNVVTGETVVRNKD